MSFDSTYLMIFIMPYNNVFFESYSFDMGILLFKCYGLDTRPYFLA